MTDNTDGFDTGIGIEEETGPESGMQKLAGYDEGQAGIVRRGYGDMPLRPVRSYETRTLHRRQHGASTVNGTSIGTTILADNRKYHHARYGRRIRQDASLTREEAATPSRPCASNTRTRRRGPGDAHRRPTGAGFPTASNVRARRRRSRPSSRRGYGHGRHGRWCSISTRRWLPMIGATQRPRMIVHRRGRWRHRPGRFRPASSRSASIRPMTLFDG